MIILGFHFDTDDFLNSEIEEELNNNELWNGCYSRGIYQPTEGVFGIELDLNISDRGSLFAPISVRTKLKIPQKIQKEVVEKFNKLSTGLQNFAKNKKVKVFKFINED